MVKCDPVMQRTTKTPEFDSGDGVRGPMRARVCVGVRVGVQACPYAWACARTRVRVRVHVYVRACVPACVCMGVR